MLASYGRSVLGAALTAVTVISSSDNLSPVDFGLEQWTQVANALWAALVPVLLRYANKKDAAFGVVAESVTKEVSKKLASKTKRK